MFENEYLKLLRINHWFKNFFVVLGSVVALWHRGEFSVSSSLAIFILGAFFLSSVISSVNYIINQITDAKYDKKHPDKKNRPIPSGTVSLDKAFVMMLMLFFASFLISLYYYSFNFTVSLIALWIAGIFYNVEPLRFKDVPYLDVVNESMNNPIRFLVGWFAVGLSSFPSPLLLLSTWTAGAVLMTAKRYDELLFFGKQLTPYRYTFKSYSLGSLKNMMIFYALATVSLLAILLSSYGIIASYLVAAASAFLYWVIKEVVSGNAKTRSAESFVLSKRFLFFAAAGAALFVKLLFY